MSNKARIGYVLKVFPRISQTFVLSEILAHERAGLPMDIFSLRRTDDTRFHAALADVQSPVFQIGRASTRASIVLDELRNHARHLPRLWEVVRDSEADAEDLLQAAELSRAIVERGIVHLHAHFGTVATVVARLAARITGITYSFTAHAKDIYHQVVCTDELRQKLADAAGVVTVSRFNVNYLQENYDSAAERVRLVYNGLDLDEFSYEPGGERSRLILGVGRLVEKKGFSYLVDACDLLRKRGVDFHCEIAGGGVLEAELQAQIKALGLEDRVHLCGPLSQRDVKRKIREAAVLAAPCLHAEDDDRDGLPTILLEAMALGTVCISTPVTGIPEILRHNDTGLMVEERDALTLANACETLLCDRRLARDLAQNARRLVEERFDIEKNTAQIRALFAEVTGIDMPAAGLPTDVLSLAGASV